MDLMQQLIVAFSLMLILEGILPFLYPQRWRNLVEKLAQISDQQLRIAGFASMLIGLVLLSALT